MYVAYDMYNDNKTELFSRLVAKTRTLGRQATFSEVNEDEDMPMANDYAYYYGSFTQAAKEAWHQVETGNISSNEISKTAKEEVKKMAKRASKEKIIKTLRDFSEKNLRLPTNLEIETLRDLNPEACPGPMAVRKYLGKKGTWSAQLFPEGLPEGFRDYYNPAAAAPPGALKSAAQITKALESKKMPRNVVASQTTEMPKETAAPEVTEAPKDVAAPEGAETTTFTEAASGSQEIVIPIRITVPEGVKISGSISLTVTF